MNDKDFILEMEKREETFDIVCPFCKETDFDFPGLKTHLQQFCEVYENLNEVQTLSEIRNYVIRKSQ
jgi:hypothetical protein